MPFYHKYYYQIIIFIASFTLLTALILQYQFNFTPCLICYYQRIPYILIIFFALLASFLDDKIELSKSIPYIILVLIIMNSLLSLYHVGIEEGYITNIISCTANDYNINSVEMLRKNIIGKINVPCEVVKVKFIFSLSGWNFFLLLMVGIFTFRHILYIKKIIK
jgi:disulfide bond formation protein DsbB